MHIPSPTVARRKCVCVLHKKKKKKKDEWSEDESVNVAMCKRRKGMNEDEVDWCGQTPVFVWRDRVCCVCVGA